MMQGKKKWMGLLFLVVMMGVTGSVLLEGQSMGLLWDSLRHVKPQFLLVGLAMMLGYVGCEALCTHRILGRLGHRIPYRQCLGYSFVGFYVSSITPSATGGQPAQIYYMSKDRIPAAHGALNMMLIAACYQTATLIWGVGIWLLCPQARNLGKGFNLLLFYGAGMMILLTAGMLMVMFLPGVSRRLCEGILKFLGKIRLLRDPKTMQGKLEHQLTEYARGAACVKANPGLAIQVLLLCLVQLGMLFTVPWMVYLAFGLSGQGWIQVAGLQAMLTLAVCNLPLPGAVGPAEGGFVSAFTAVFGSGLVTPAMLVSRGISFYTFLLISFLVSVFVHVRVSRQARERALREMIATQPGNRIQAMRRYLHGQSKACMLK